MADDIDIEEHDVLESLRQRQLEVTVKDEPMDVTDSDPQYEDSDSYFQSQWEWDSHTTDTPQIKVETPEDAEQFHLGKIILGSKPPLEKQDEPDSVPTDTNYNYNMSLVLDDWGPILQRSNCYCPDCGTLFATVNALDAHKMIAHSFLIETDKEPSPERNKAVKSTARNEVVTCNICSTQFHGKMCRNNLRRHQRNFHSIEPNDVESAKEKAWKVCNHCNVSFPNDTALVKHLYALLPLNDLDKTPVKEDKKTPVKIPSAVKIPVKFPSALKTPANIPSAVRTPVKVPSATKTILNDNLNVTPVMNTYEKKSVQIVQSSFSSSTSHIKSAKVPSSTVVKDVRPVKTLVKHTNSIILGSKVNNAKLDVKEEPQDLGGKKERTCEICGVPYNYKYYMLHMKKFHNEFLMNKLGRPNIQLVQATNKWKCKLCNKVFVGKIAAKQHRAKHPDVEKKKLLIKLVNIVKPQAKAVKAEPVEENTDMVVSKSTLFKCNLCSCHFLTCIGACAHSRVCETSSNLRLWSCPDCQRVFKNVDKKAHELQHRISNFKFKVYVVYLEMVVRILCECPTCNVCFEEYKFWRHMNMGCEGNAQAFHCEECELPIDATSNVSHMSKHNQGDFTKEDFIKIDFVSVPEPREVPTPLKRKLPPPDIEVKKPINNKLVKAKDIELVLIYCGYCKCYLNRRSKIHSAGLCKRNTKKRTACKTCCLSFTNKSYDTHRKLHKKYPKLTILDLQFHSLLGGKKIKPHPEYYPCKSCQVNFACLWNKRSHVCNETKVFTCPVCQRKIEKASQKAHMRFHIYGAKSAKSPSPSKSSNQTLKPKASTSEGLPELLMKYQSLTTLWNILHLCITCDTFTDSYDKVVEHCQKHVTNMESYGVVIMKCQVCNMKFDEDCYRRHEELHSGGDITRKSFKILRYDHTKLFDENWQNYLDLPEDQKSQILNRSIYGDNISIKMKLVQQGPPEYTVYRCVQCKKCVGAAGLAYHVTLQHCVKSNKVHCSFCDLFFSTKQPLEEHETLHQNADLSADSFRIVEFKDPIDEEYYNKVDPESSVRDSTKASVATVASVPSVASVPTIPTTDIEFAEENVKVIKGKKFYMFYKCDACGLCSPTKKRANAHVCSNLNKKTCPKCKLTFQKLALHYRLHERYDFTERNIFTKAFNNKLKIQPDPANSNSDPTKEATLYKCHCGLHYTSMKTIEKHYQLKNCISVVREECSQCNLIFDATEIVNHLCKHHAQNRFSKFHVITPVKKTLYQCIECSVLFLNRIIAATHLRKCDRTKGVKCGICGLLFHHTVIETHKEDHRTNEKNKPDCYIIVKVPKTESYSNLLYRCKRCNVNFMQVRALRAHVQSNHAIGKLTECDICKLMFTHKTLQVHVKYHHNMLKATKFRFKYFGAEVGPVEYEIIAKKSTPKQILSNKKPSGDKIDKEKTLVRPVKEIEQGLTCHKCDLNFTDLSTLKTHNDDRCSKELTETCHVCDKKYSSRNIKEHLLKVHDIQKNTSEPKNDVEKVVEDTLQESDKTIYRCRKCNFHYNNLSTVEKHQKLNAMKIKCVAKRPIIMCEECNIGFSNITFKRHTVFHEKFGLKKDDFNIVEIPSLNGKAQDSLSVDDIQSQSSIGETPSMNETVESLDSSFELDTSDTKVDKKDMVKIKLYKCADCNVYFLTQRICYKHAVKHTALEAKDFIECKLCGYQFTIMALQTHIKKHHATEFNLEKVLVEEYQPNVLENNVPKIEIYYAIDKDQSRLVSTTTDVKKTTDSEAAKAVDENQSSEVTSNVL